MAYELINNSHESDQSIVKLCIESRADAWDLFFIRFIPVMLNAIKSTLYGYGEYGKKLAQDEANLWDIFEILYERLHKGSLLERCKNTSGIRSWLTTVAANQTRDWMKAQLSEDNLPNWHAENSKISLDQPLYNDSNMTLLETNLSNTDFEESIQDLFVGQSGHPLLEENSASIALAHISLAILIHLSSLDQSFEPNHRRNFWIARINYMAIYPLIDHEIDAIVEFANLNKSDLLQSISTLINKFEVSEVEKEAALGRAEIIRHKLLRAEAKSNHYRNDPTPEGKKILDDLEKKIKSMSERRKELLHTGFKTPRPSAKETVELLKLPNKMVNQVSKILSRLQLDLLDVLQEQLKKSDK